MCFCVLSSFVLLLNRTEVMMVARYVFFCVITSRSASLLRLVQLAGQQRDIQKGFVAVENLFYQ